MSQQNLLIALLLVICIQMVLTLVLVYTVFHPSEDRLRALHYETEAATLVSPHSLREELERGEENYVIVDTRDRESYRQGHITTAINITPGEGMVKVFRKLQVQNPDKEILIYCYTEVCMRGRKVGRELARNGIFVQEVGVGFNEWKNYWKKWNYENEWDHIDINDYITVGDEPGELGAPHLENLLNTSACGTDPSYSC